MEAMKLSKVIAHNSAAYSPTLRQIRSGNLLARRVSKMRIPDADWSNYTAELYDEGGRNVRAAKLPLYDKRLGIKALIKAHPRKKPANDNKVSKKRLSLIQI